jgi:single-strand DNA-binding protein
MNNVTLIGRLTRDPEVRYTSGTQMAVARFTIAVDRQFKRDGEPTADFIPIVAFGKTAELCERYISKGRQVAVEGRIQTGSYTNKDGNKVYTTDVVANRVEFLGGREGGSGSGFGQGQTSAPSVDMGIPEGFSAIDDDDIPF